MAGDGGGGGSCTSLPSQRWLPCVTGTIDGRAVGESWAAACRGRQAGVVYGRVRSALAQMACAVYDNTHKQTRQK